MQFLHWEFVDPDSIPVCGFQWNHWSLANLPVDALMYDFNDSHALAIPADFSRTVSAMIPETVQGRTSAASPLLKGRSGDPAVTMRYNGPYPPDRDHEYYLHVWGTTAPLNGLNQGFWLNEMERALRNSGCDRGPRRYLPDRQGVTGETGENSRQGANRVIARKYQRIPQT